MRMLYTGLVAALFTLPLGCGGDDKSKTVDEKTSPPKTQSVTGQGGQPKTKTEVAAVTPKKTESPTNESPKSTATASHPVAKFAPDAAVAMVSINVQEVIGSDLLKYAPEVQQQIPQVIARAGEAGVDLKKLERVTVFAWPGKPSFPGMHRTGRKSLEEPEFDPADDGAKKEDPSGAAFVAPPGTQFVNYQPGGFGPGGPPDPEQLIQAAAKNMDIAFVAEFSEPTSIDTLLKSNPYAKVKDATAGNWKYKKWVEPAATTALYKADESTFVIAGVAGMETMAKATGNGPLAKQAAKGGLDHDISLLLPLEANRGIMKAGLQDLPPQMGGILGFVGLTVEQVQAMPDQLDALRINIDADPGVAVNLVINGNTKELAQTLNRIAGIGLNLGREQLKSQDVSLVRQFGEDLGAEAYDTLNEIAKDIQSEAIGNDYSLTVKVPEKAIQLAMRIQAATTKKFQAVNNMKQILLALLNYEATFRKYPFPGGPKEGAPKLSWRVYLLPYLDEIELYEKFKLDEPWDSEHNKPLAEQMPDIFKLSDDAKPNHTQYVAPSGPGLTIDGDKSRKIAQYADGTSNTVVVVTVKAEHAVPWTKPGDLDVNLEEMAKAVGKLGGHGADGMIAGFADGSARRWKVDEVSAETWKKLFTINGREVIEDGEIDR